MSLDTKQNDHVSIIDWDSDRLLDAQVRLSPEVKAGLSIEERVATTVFDKLGIRDPETIVSLIADSRQIRIESDNPELTTEAALDFVAGTMANMDRRMGLTVFDGLRVFNFKQVGGHPQITIENKLVPYETDTKILDLEQMSGNWVVSESSIRIVGTCNNSRKLFSGGGSLSEEDANKSLEQVRRLVGKLGKMHNRD